MEAGWSRWRKGSGVTKEYIIKHEGKSVEDCGENSRVVGLKTLEKETNSRAGVGR